MPQPASSITQRQSRRRRKPLNYEFPIQPVGTRVAIRCAYDGTWSRGFLIHDVLSDDDRTRYRICRSDGSVLPVVFDAQDIIPDRR